MKVFFVLSVFCVTSSIAIRRGSPLKKEDDDLRPEASRRRIYDIIQEHEGRKYGDHGGHEYEDGEVPGALKSRKSHRIGYLPVAEEGKSSYYYADAPKRRLHPKDNVYRENVAAYAVKDPRHIHVGNAPYKVIASPLTHSHYTVVDPKVHEQYVVYDEPKPHYKSAPVVVQPKHTYILEEEPHYVPPIQAKPPVAHYPAPVKEYVPVKNYAPVKEYVPVAVKKYVPVPVKDYNSHYDSHHKLDEQSHHASGHGHYDDNGLYKESGHKSSGKHEIAGHKAHSSSLGHHDEHDHHHNKAHYERDRGYHYEKAYAYDRVRATHDIGSDKGSHSAYKAHHGNEGYKNAGDHGSQSYMYFKKHGQNGGHGYHDNKNSLYKTDHHGSGGQGYHKYLPHHHAYGK